MNMKKINRFFNLHRVFTRIRRPFVFIKHFFENLWFYFPFIVSDRDYDYSFLTELMAAKLEKMANNFQRTQFYEGWEQDVRDMRGVAELLRLMPEEPWCELADRDFYEMSSSGLNINVDIYEMYTKYERAYLSTLFEKMAERIRFWWW